MNKSKKNAIVYVVLALIAVVSALLKILDKGNEIAGLVLYGVMNLIFVLHIVESASLRKRNKELENGGEWHFLNA